MRGKEDALAKLCYRSRITPAYAGKRQVVCIFSLPIEDHPRLCGEKLFNVRVLRLL